MLNPMITMQVNMIKVGLSKLTMEQRQEVIREIGEKFCLRCGGEKNGHDKPCKACGWVPA